MTTYKIRVLTPFSDIETGKMTKFGDIVETASIGRVRNIIDQKLGEFVSAQHDGKKGKKVFFHFSEMYRVGGIETAAQHIARAFADYDITFCIKHADPAQALESAKRCNVIIDNGVDNYDTDVLVLMNYDSAQNIIKRVTARKVYQFCHADWQGLLDIGAFRGFKLQIDKRVDKVLAVSETAQKGLKTAFNIDSIVVPNILCPLENKRLVFLVLSRATNEKGIDRLLDMVDCFNAAGKEFVVFLCSPLEQAQKHIQDRIKKTKNVVVLPATPYSQELIKCASYGVALSSNESYCYAAREYLQAQVPIIVSDIPELKKLVKEGENGYVLKSDLSNLDIDKIFNHIPKPKAYSEEIDPKWYKLMEGEL